MNTRTRVVLIGGPDVDARLPLMERLSVEYDVMAFGSAPQLVKKFQQRGFGYASYQLDRRVRPLADVRTLRQLTAMLREHAPDVVHAFDTKPGVFGCIAARRAGVPVVVNTVTGLGSLYSSQGVRTSVLRRIYSAMQRAASRRAALTIFQNHDDLAELVKAGVVREQDSQVILGSGVETNRYSRSEVSGMRRAALRRELGFDENSVVITMIGRVTRTKGVLEFAEAAASVRLVRPRAKFLLIGPDDTDSLDRLTDEEKDRLRSVVVWPGPRDDIVDILAASDLFVLPTAYREGIPRVLLEAASMGLPMVTTDSPGCNEAVAHGQNGLLVPAQDARALTVAIDELVGDDAKRTRFGAFSRSRAVSLFDIEVVARQISEVYRRLLDRVMPAGVQRGTACRDS